MTDTWRFIIVVTLLICVAGLLPLAADERPVPPGAPVTAQGGASG